MLTPNCESMQYGDNELLCQISAMSEYSWFKKNVFGYSGPSVHVLYKKQWEFGSCYKYWQNMGKRWMPWLLPEESLPGMLRLSQTNAEKIQLVQIRFDFCHKTQLASLAKLSQWCTESHVWLSIFVCKHYIWRVLIWRTYEASRKSRN